MKRSVTLLLAILVFVPGALSQDRKLNPHPSKQRADSSFAPCLTEAGTALDLDAWIRRIPENKPRSTSKDSLIQLSLNYLNFHDFDCVFHISDRLQDRFPEDPDWPFLAANAYQSIMRDYRVRIHEDLFEAKIAKAIELAETRVKTDKRAEDAFILASAQGYLGFHQFRKGQWLPALNRISKSISNFRRAYALNEDFVDPLLGLALYEFGKSKVPLVSGDLNKAIQYLEKVEQRGRFVSVDALFSHQLLYVHMKEFEKALAVNDRLYASYPDSPVCLYNRGLLLELTGRFDEAILAWLALISRIEAFGQPSNGYLAEGHFHLSENFHYMGRGEASRKALREAARYTGLYREEDELDGPYQKFASVKKAIEKAVKERLAVE